MACKLPVGSVNVREMDWAPATVGAMVPISTQDGLFAFAV